MNNGQMYLHKDLQKLAVLRSSKTNSALRSAFVYNLGTGRRTAVSIRPENLTKNYRPISN
ncbi:hypothetical protein ADL22_12255 [Streptomyces sp. NRRL F-4489]|uniref:hypothetical protein n=1 Tax=Streptomyces sp. NRRL F-4489 TaxID=1609095 RepID=UPI00074B1E90|nr:hypothetical protein [Streptomyces sp. NRRL F-4489]KUL44709.1 hypothetical protein ADL22_12255 [Streptomyces sp. NRRL F-4489]